jgi:hypothetical protein
MFLNHPAGYVASEVASEVASNLANGRALCPPMPIPPLTNKVSMAAPQANAEAAIVAFGTRG